MNVAVNEAANAISRAEGRNIDTSNFIVTITDKNNKEVSYNGNECKWTYGSMPEIITLPIGQYYVNVISRLRGRPPITREQASFSQSRTTR